MPGDLRAGGHIAQLRQRETHLALNHALDGEAIGFEILHLEESIFRRRRIGRPIRPLPLADFTFAELARQDLVADQRALRPIGQHIGLLQRLAHRIAALPQKVELIAA
ncbi:hypothetical protein D3C87_1770040 [compost metagenome]